jgi:dUTPase
MFNVAATPESAMSHPSGPDLHAMSKQVTLHTVPLQEVRKGMKVNCNILAVSLAKYVCLMLF